MAKITRESLICRDVEIGWLKQSDGAPCLLRGTKGEQCAMRAARTNLEGEGDA